jgi:electron transfer flavoprotein alpha subunit
LVCGEVKEGKITSVTKELMNIGGKLSKELNQPLDTLLIGKNLQGEIAEAITLGSKTVYSVNASPFAESHPDLYVALITEACLQVAPSIILLGHTEMGREVAPRLAFRLKASVTMDCTGLSIDPETRTLLQSKPVYGGNAIAIWASESSYQQVVTLRPRAIMPAEPNFFGKGEIKPLNVTVKDSLIKGKVLQTVKEEVKGIKLEDAKIIIAGGGGIGGSDGFKLLEELSQVLGGAIGVTRVPCDEGWRPLGSEIGQTGHIVTPRLYIAIGISGAPQHMAGCSGSKNIIAINRDPDAPILKEADFGVIGDYRQVLPTMIDKCKTLVK